MLTQYLNNLLNSDASINVLDVGQRFVSLSDSVFYFEDKFGVEGRLLEWSCMICPLRLTL